MKYSESDVKPINLSWMHWLQIILFYLQSKYFTGQLNNKMSSERRNNVLCDTCTSKGKSAAGLVFCSQCREIYCSLCAEFHQAFSLTKNHNILEISVDTKDKERDSKLSMSKNMKSEKYDQTSFEEECASDFMEPVISTKYSGTMRCSVQGDTNNSWIWAIDVTKDGDIVMLDYKNSSLKVFDGKFESKYRLVSSTCVSSSCTGMTVVDDNLIAVTCGNKILFYKCLPTRNLKLQQRTFRLSGFCWSISYSTRRYAVVCNPYKPDGSICILNSAGHQLNLIKSVVIKGLKVILSHFFTLDPTYDKLYLSDTIDGRVICINFLGVPLWHTDSVSSPLGLEVWKGSLLVANEKKHEIASLSESGHLLDPLATHKNGLIVPEYLKISSDGVTLLVTGKGLSIVKLFPLV